MFAAAAQRATIQHKNRNARPTPYSRNREAKNMVFQPTKIAKPIKAASAFAAFRETGNIEALLVHLHQTILAAELASARCFDPHFIGSQLVALLLCEYNRTNATDGFKIKDNVSSNAKYGSQRLKKLTYNVSHLSDSRRLFASGKEFASRLEVP